MPRSRHGEWTAHRDRDEILDLLHRSDRGREARLLPVRYRRMASSPFGFFRGAAAVMAHDLATTPVTGIRVQLAGDAHVSNFGLFGTPERNLVFDANDFDETLPGPWEWDLKRLATSLVLVGQLHQFSPRAIRRSVRVAVRAYGEQIAIYAGLTYLDTWYAHLDLPSVGEFIDEPGLALFRDQADQARDKTGYHTFPKATRTTGGEPRIRDRPPLIRHYSRPSQEAEVRRLFDRYAATLSPERRQLYDRYRLVDVAEKVVGVGSIGTRCSVGLFLGDTDLVDPLFLQVKEARASVYEPHLGPSPFDSHAQRVVFGQRAIQEASDIFLGWGSVGRRDFYVRQLRDMKFTSDIMALAPGSVVGLAQLCGSALARAHARTGDPSRLAGYLGSGPAMEAALTKFAFRYARQTEEDHAALIAAIRAGRVHAARGP